MKPARSPRFQSAAERTSIAAISACGSPSGTFGAEHAATARTRYHARYMEPLFGKKLDWNAPRERPSEMALAIRTALPRWSTRCASGDVSWPPASSSCRPSSPWPWAAISWPSSAPWAVRASAASSSSSAPAPPSSALAAGRERKEVDTSAPSCRGRSSCSPRNRLARASDLSFAGCAWAWPIAYPASLSPQVTMQEAPPHGVAARCTPSACCGQRGSRRRRAAACRVLAPRRLRVPIYGARVLVPPKRGQVSLTMRLTNAYLRAAMIARTLVAGLALAVPPILHAQNVAEVQVAPPSVTIKVGERTGLLATAFDRIGNVIPTVRVIWSSNNVQVARVDNDGTVSGVAGGVAIIEARVGARKGQAAVQVIGAAPASAQPPQGGQAGGGRPTGAGGQPAIEPLAGQPPGSGPASVLRIQPPTIYLLPSENTRGFPRAPQGGGSPPAPLPVTWKSLREDIASIDPNGVVRALSSGQGTGQVTAPGGLTATAPVVVQQTEVAILEQSPIALSPGDVDTLHVVVPAQGNRRVRSEERRVGKECRSRWSPY